MLNKENIENLSNIVVETLNLKEEINKIQTKYKFSTQKFMKIYYSKENKSNRMILLLKEHYTLKIMIKKLDKIYENIRKIDELTPSIDLYLDLQKGLLITLGDADNLCNILENAILRLEEQEENKETL